MDWIKCLIKSLFFRDRIPNTALSVITGGGKWVEIPMSVASDGRAGKLIGNSLDHPP